MRQISKTYNVHSAEPVHALQEVSLVIPDRSFVVVVGPNGSGKSTLLNVLAGNIRPDAGQVILDGTDITALRDYERSKRMARIFQNPLTGTSPDLTVLENFRLAALRTGKKQFRIGTGEAFRKMVLEKVRMPGLGLENKIDQPMGALSGGQRQALTLLMAVMPVPEEQDKAGVLLMDEPTAALDPKSAVLILELADKIISEYNLTVILVTHQLKDALRYGNRILCMEGGRIARDLSGEAKVKLSLSEMYGWFE